MFLLLLLLAVTYPPSTDSERHTEVDVWLGLTGIGTVVEQEPGQELGH